MTAALKVFTKAELFDKDMTLKKLQTICTKLGVAFETDANKATLANAVLKKQKELELTTPDAEGSVGESGDAQEPTSDGPAAGVDDATVAEVAAQNEEDAKAVVGSEWSTEGVDYNGLKVNADAAVENPANDLVPEGHREKVTEDSGIPTSVLEELKGVLSVKDRVDSLERKVEAKDERDKEILDRVRNVEKAVEKLIAYQKNGNTLHGSIDALPKIEDLPPPGTIDDLPKIG